MTELALLQNVRPNAESVTDILIENGRIAKIAPEISDLPADVTLLDGGGDIALPGLIEAHTHMDKTLYGLSWQPHSAGPTIRDKVDNERRIVKKLNIDSAQRSATQTRLEIGNGSTHIRTHVDVNNERGLGYLEGVLATQAAFKESVSIQIVAFPQQGILASPGTEAYLNEAAKLGIDCIGGIDPSVIERDPVKHLDIIFGIAGKHGLGIDIHLHEPGQLGAFTVELIAERTKALGLRGKVMISHAFCLGGVDEPYLDRLTQMLLDNEIAIMTHGPGQSVYPPILKLAAAGVILCTGSDGIRDSWGPYGNGDMLERVMWLGYRSNFRRDEELAIALSMATTGAAKALGVENYGLDVGCDADIVVVKGETVAQAIMDRAARRLVLKRGKVTAAHGHCLV